MADILDTAEDRRTRARVDQAFQLGERNGRGEGARQERYLIVTSLRKAAVQVTKDCNHDTASSALAAAWNTAADQIEAGDHIPKEDDPNG